MKCLFFGVYIPTEDIGEPYLSRSNPSSVGTHTRVYSLIVFLNSYIHSHIGAMGARKKIKNLNLLLIVLSFEPFFRTKLELLIV